ncbi:ubiquitin-protein ligase [Trichosporon asahii var. asahii CBS 8904]|uniref:Cullin-1 n=2 Tax=Trichosporon asahii var. asahii TaxID=189963 RepID=K1WJT1_TRIAC|nr:ubiquitin-protein ligase [Trichosporon asahii var. asahii CBS 2479]EJT47779.1 ubiquitin-protein ligase [Trichosporon asahii var. asahii CBS 2479]EKD01624.1 ubiquitin-protein ligase [Trichosporon asahii var. asahii CBS 8904]
MGLPRGRCRPHHVAKLGMSYQYYILLYTSIYDYCTNSARGGLNLPQMPRGAGASLQGAELYKKLSQFLAEHCKSMRELNDLELLKYYARQWDRYTMGARYVNKLFNYLNKHWVKREKDEGRKDVYTVYTLALVMWKRQFFTYIKQESDTTPSRLTLAVLRQIELQRNGEIIDNSLLKKVIESYVALGIDDADAQRQNLEVYQDCFQKFFIDATEKYYTAESSAFVASNSVPDYMKKAEERLAEEADRINLYLHDSTRVQLKDTCEEVLINQHREIMWNEFQPLLDADREADLARMYGLLSRVRGLDPLRKKFEDHVKRAGLAAVERVVPAPGAVNEQGKPETLDPKAYIEALLSVHSKFGDIVNGPFNSELGFNASLDKACREFVNSNAAATTPTKSPELLASYCDQLLKKSNRDLDPDALENALNQSMVIFKFIDDKDVFQKFYQRRLASRLVNGTSASEDSESSMISKLKELSGYDYTNKLTRMFSDVSVGRDITEKFKEKERRDNSPDDIDFTIMVLGTNFWPLTPQNTEYNVPREIRGVYDRFTRFYNDVHSGRKLTWLWHVSKGEMRPTYLGQKYIFMVSAYQLVILCQFNENDSLTFKEIQTGTGLAEGILKSQLNLLTKLKVLTNDGDTYDLNMHFKSKKIRVQLNQPVRAEQKAEAKEVLQSVDEDRKFVYQANIVRLMKARKHQQLIQEVTAQISQKFTPKVSEIKKAIDHLIDKEYLERGEEKDQYNYLA